MTNSTEKRKELLEAKESQINKTYSEKSFRYFLYAVAGFFILCFGAIVNVANFIPYFFSDLLFAISGLIMVVFSIKGLINAIHSILKKEDHTFNKLIGCIGNLVIVLLLLVGLIININIYYLN